MTIANAPETERTIPHGSPAPKTVLIQIENSYSDGHRSTRQERIAPPEKFEEGALEAWWDDEVFDLTGDGHGEMNPDLDALYTATVLAGPIEMLGKTYTWG